MTIDRPDLLEELFPELSGTNCAPSASFRRSSQALTSRREQASVGSPELLLTGLRGLLIVWVLCEHFMADTWTHTYGKRFKVNTGLFIILSGFSALVWHHNTRFQGNAKWWPYIRSRFVGLFPMYYLALLCLAPFFIAMSRRPGFHIVPNLPDGAAYPAAAFVLATGMQAVVSEATQHGDYFNYISVSEIRCSRSR
jgi:peptidoglycan/LPS O-acetylase OafA/YrhL